MCEALKRGRGKEGVKEEQQWKSEKEGERVSKPVF